MEQSFIDRDKIDRFAYEEFEKRWPYPWIEFNQFLTPEGFKKLYEDFPSLEFFEYHQGIMGTAYSDRPHDRYYLAYESSFYHQNKEEKESGAGVIQARDLKENWRAFIQELEGPYYQEFIRRAMGSKDFHLRYAWHMGKSSNEVSPHVDSSSKIGTHIFYFNVSEDWDPAWGGSLLVLGGKMTPKLPDFDDFLISIPVKNLDNHSFLFKNRPDGWHGVKSLTCPEGKYRKLFNVIFEKNKF